MPDANISERSPKAVICLEGSIQLWKVLKRALDGIDGPSQFIFARSEESSSEILSLCRRLAPALVVIEESRIQAIPFKQLRDMIGRRDIQVLVFSDQAEESGYEELFRMGCTGVVPHKVTHQILKKAVLALCEGELWLPRRVLSKLAQEVFLRGNPPKITQRESEIFKLICLGFTNQQIAEHLFISRETVRWHLRGLYSKIGVETRSQAMRYAKYGSESDPDLNSTSSDPPIG